MWRVGVTWRAALGTFGRRMLGREGWEPDPHYGGPVLIRGLQLDGQRQLLVAPTRSCYACQVDGYGVTELAAGQFASGLMPVKP